MTTKSVFASLTMVAFAATAFADVPDGRGGRTSPQGLNAKPAAVTAAARACCNKMANNARRQAVSAPAEVKGLGHLSWVSRMNDPTPAMACSKRDRAAQATYGSPAELKARGHLASQAAVPAVAAVKGCCADALCPMRRS